MRSRVVPKPNPKTNLNANSNPKLNTIPNLNPKPNLISIKSDIIVKPKSKPKSKRKDNDLCINTLKMKNGFLFVGSNNKFIKVYNARNIDTNFEEITNIDVVKGPVRDIIFVNDNLYATCGFKKEKVQKLDCYFNYPVSYQKFNVTFNPDSNIDPITSTFEKAFYGIKTENKDTIRGQMFKEKNLMITSFFINEDIENDGPLLGCEKGWIQNKRFKYNHFNQEQQNQKNKDPVFDIKVKNNKIYSCCGKFIYIWNYISPQTETPNNNLTELYPNLTELYPNPTIVNIIDINLENKVFTRNMSLRRIMNATKSLSSYIPYNTREIIAKKTLNNTNSILLKGSELENQVYNFVFINETEILFTLFNSNNAFILDINTKKIRDRLPEEQIDYSVISNPKVFKKNSNNKWFFLSGVKDGKDIVLIFLDKQPDNQYKRYNKGNTKPKPIKKPFINPSYILYTENEGDINDILINNDILLTCSEKGFIRKWDYPNKLLSGGKKKVTTNKTTTKTPTTKKTTANNATTKKPTSKKSTTKKTTTNKTTANNATIKKPTSKKSTTKKTTTNITTANNATTKKSTTKKNTKKTTTKKTKKIE